MAYSCYFLTNSHHLLACSFRKATFRKQKLHNTAFLWNLKHCIVFFFSMTAYSNIVQKKMTINGFKIRYIWGRSLKKEENDWALCSFGRKLNHQSVLDSRRASCPLRAPLSKKLVFILFRCLFVSNAPWPFPPATLASCLLADWLVNDLEFSDHVIRQQLMQRGASLLFKDPLFLFGVRMAMMASSNTVFRPFWVSAEHST